MRLVTLSIQVSEEFMERIDNALLHHWSVTHKYMTKRDFVREELIEPSLRAKEERRKEIEQRENSGQCSSDSVSSTNRSER